MYDFEENNDKPSCKIKVKCDDRMVKVLTREEWQKIQNHLHESQNNLEKNQKKLEERERIKEKSYEIHKDWTNTILGLRKKKLAEREERLRKEEEERVAVDEEWAKVKAEERKKKICEARNAQLFETPRIRKLHIDLRTGDATKENDLQLQLKQMQLEVEKQKREKEFQELIKSIKEAEEEERKQCERKRADELQIRQFQREQIQEHIQLAEERKAAEKAEGETIRRLAVEAEGKLGKYSQALRDEHKKAFQDLQDSVELRNKMNTVQRIREEEEEEKRIIYATAKREMTKTLLEHQKTKADERQTMQEKLAKSLAEKVRSQLELKVPSEEAHLKLEEERYKKRVENETKKRQEALDAIEAHRLATLKATAEQKTRQIEHARAELQHNIEMDEAAKKEDEELRWKRRQECRELSRIYLEEMARKAEERRREKLEGDEWWKRFHERSAREEEIFQEYAKRVIGACEETGIPTYAMKKTAGRNVVAEGVPKNLCGDFGEDGEGDKEGLCHPLPDVPPYTENVKL